MVDVLFAADTNSTLTKEATNWLLGFLGVVGAVALILTVVNLWKNLNKKKKRIPLRSVFITRKEFLTLTASAKQEIDHLEVETKRELQRIELDLKRMIVANEEYSRNRIHEQAGTLQVIMNKQAALPMEVREMIDSAIGPISAQSVRHSNCLVAIMTKMNIDGPDLNSLHGK